MKTNRFFLTAALLIGLFLLPSCLDDDNDSNLYFPNALVTVKNAADGTVFLQLDNETTLLPVNLKTSPFGEKEGRALVNYDEVQDPSKEYSKSVHVNWIDTIRTKNMAPNLGLENEKEYGNDPVEIVNDWVTVAEDGYLTLRFRTYWGYSRITHYVNLVSTDNPDNPYEVQLLHDANGDIGGRLSDGLVAFKLNELPDTKGEEVKLKLIWKSFNGEKSVEFNYSTNGSNPVKSAVLGSPSEIPVE